MQDLIIPVNNEALARAMTAVVGDETAALITKAYQQIDGAMWFGYQRGLKDAGETAEKAAEETKSDDGIQSELLYRQAKLEGFEEGCRQRAEDEWEAGYARGFDDGEEVTGLDETDYDSGYVDGVSDARVWPAVADAQVARICQADEFEQYVHDSLFDDFEPFDYDDFEPIEDDTSYFTRTSEI